MYPLNYLIHFKSFFLPQEEGEWPSLSALHLPSSDMVTRRDVSNDSGIHEMTEEKRRSLKRIE